MAATNGINGVVQANGVHSKSSTSSSDFSSFKVNQSRLMEHLHDGCQHGAAWRYGE